MAGGGRRRLVTLSQFFGSKQHMNSKISSKPPTNIQCYMSAISHILKGEKEVALNEYMTAFQFNNKDVDLIETIAVQLEGMKDVTKACEFYERLIELEPKNINALQKLASFRESIGDYRMAFEYIEKLKEVDPRNQFVSDNFDAYKDRAENGVSFLSFLKSIFGKRM